MSEPDLLLLDEPTNHLDIPAQEVLQEVLENFAGTILLVMALTMPIEAVGSTLLESSITAVGSTPDRSALSASLLAIM